MRPAHHGRFQRQVEFLRQQFLQGGGLPFTDVLTAECISKNASRGQTLCRGVV